MAYVWQRWMVAEFRAAGLDVIEVAGWENRGRPASSGPFDPSGLNIHHVGATSSAKNPTPGLRVLADGRDDLPGPIAHYGTDWYGRIWLIATGRANVNGANRGVPNFPGRDGNRDLLGNEVFTDGRQTMPKAQREAIALSSAVVLAHYGKDPDGYLYRHADTSTTGKWDIGQLTTAQLRADVRALYPVVQEDTMSPEQERALHQAIANVARVAQSTDNGVAALIGVADRPLEVEARLTARIEALTSVVTALAEDGGLDAPALLEIATKAAETGATTALSRLRVITTGEGGA